MEQILFENTVYSKIKEIFENEVDFINYPNTKAELKNNVSNWLRISINYANSIQPAINGRSFVHKRYSGVIFVQLFVRQGSGLQKQQDLINLAYNNFDQILLDQKYTILSGTTQHVGINTDSYYQTNVMFNFSFDEFRNYI